MIEKTSENTCCILCGKPATTVIAGNPYCQDCAKSGDTKEAEEMIELFKES